MTEIPLEKEITRFYTHLTNNPRVVFSAKFGEGKTHFLEKFRQYYNDSIRFIPLYPVNYAVATNEDIFEYIKRDILLQLKNDDIAESIDIDAFTQSLFTTENVLEVVEFLTASLPYGNVLNKVIEKGVKLKERYDEKKNSLGKYKAQFRQKGSIYERDSYTKLIENIVSRLQENSKKVVLLIEDLDRIDPRHLFRILNVLGAHIDEKKGTNKFGVDNIVIVMDYDITKHIFHHFYGSEANYEGYIAKFISHYPYHYSITEVARKHLYDFIKEKCGLTEVDCSNIDLGSYSQPKTLSNLIGKLSVRDIVHLLDDLHKQYRAGIYEIDKNVFINTDTQLVRMLAILKRMQYPLKLSRVEGELTKLDNFTGYRLLGDFMLHSSSVRSGRCFRSGNEYICFNTDKDINNVYTCEVQEVVSIQPIGSTEIARIVRQALTLASEFVHELTLL